MAQIERRNGSVSTRVAYHDETGRRKQKRITAPDESQLQVAVARWIAAHADGAVEPSNQPLARYLRGWHRTLRRTSSTRRIYERIITHIEQHPVGSKPLGKLRRHHIQSWVDELAERYEPATVRQWHACLRSALTAATRLELIPRNPALGIDLPPAVESSWVMLDSAQVHRLIHENSDDPYHAAWVLAVTLGLRKGELLSLMWSDIDLGRGELRVARTVRRAEDSGWFIADMPKTTKSRRVLRLPLTAQLALKRHQSAQETRRAALGSRWIVSGMVFDAGHGEPHPHPTILQNAWAATRARLGFPTNTRLHDLRHTAISNMLAIGLPITTVATIAGHASPAITLSTYSHIVSAMMDDAVSRMDALYGGVSESEPKVRRLGDVG
jgi:integrase